MFKRTILRNLIYMIPAFIILMSLFVISSQLSILDDNRIYVLNDISDIQTAFRLGKQNVEIQPDDILYSSGFDVVQGDKVTGSYYYIVDGNRIIFFALSNETIALLDEDRITDKIRVRLVQEDAVINYIESEYNDRLNLGDGALEEYFEPIVLSEVEFPQRRIFLIRLTRICSVFLMIFLVIYINVYTFYNPGKLSGRDEQQDEKNEKNEKNE